MNGKSLLLAATALTVIAGVAVAQQPATYDPSRLPAITGTVTQYSLTPRGDVDGIILQDGTQVHLPPHLGPQLVAAVKPGDTVEVRGLKAQALPVVQAVSVTSPTSGGAVTDAGPPVVPPHPLTTASQWMMVQGVVREPLYGPLGDLNGALLDDGAQVHLPSDRASQLYAELQAGKPLVAEGYGIASPYGRALDAQRIGATVAQLVQVGPPGVPPPPTLGAPPAPPPGVLTPPPPGPPAAPGR